MNREFAFTDMRNTLVHARACDELWWTIEGTHPERETIVSGCNQYLHFFQTVRSSMFLSYVILLSSLFDNREDCITLKSLPEFKNDRAFQELWNRGRRLYKYRSKSIAHRDIKSDENNYAEATGFSYNQVRAILSDSIALYDRVARKQNRVEVSSIDISPKTDFLQLMRKLRTIENPTSRE